MKKIVLRHFQVNYTWFFKEPAGRHWTQPGEIQLEYPPDPNLQTPALVKRVDILNCWQAETDKELQILKYGWRIEYEGTEKADSLTEEKVNEITIEAPTCHPNIFQHLLCLPSILKCFIPFTFHSNPWAKNNYPAAHGGGRRGEIACQSYWGCGKDKIGTQFRLNPKWAHKLCTLLPLLTKSSGEPLKGFKLEWSDQIHSERLCGSWT